LFPSILIIYVELSSRVAILKVTLQYTQIPINIKCKIQALKTWCDGVYLTESEMCKNFISLFIGQYSTYLFLVIRSTECIRVLQLFH